MNQLKIQYTFVKKSIKSAQKSFLFNYHRLETLIRSLICSIIDLLLKNRLFLTIAVDFNQLIDFFQKKSIKIKKKRLKLVKIKRFILIALSIFFFFFEKNR